MIFRLKNFLFFAIASLVLASQASADVQISLDSSGATTINIEAEDNSALIEFYLSQTASDNILAIVADFEFAAGVITGPAQIAAAGVDDGSGLFAAGNLAASDIFFTGANSINIDQEFNVAQAPPTSPSRQRWFSISLDTTGVTPGTYAINLASPNTTFVDSALNGITANNNLQLNITAPAAVPEPSSVSLVLIAIAGGMVRRRRAI